MNKLPKKAQEWLDKELTDNDRRRMSQIKWRRVGDKYFSYFTDPEDAYKWLAYQAHRYKYSPTGVLTVKDICEESQELGINLYPTQTGRWFSEVFGLDIAYTGHPETGRKIKTFHIDQDVAEMFEALGDANEYGILSEFYNVCMRFIMSLPFDGMLVIFDETPVLFMKFKGQYQAIVFDDLPKEHRKYVDGLLYDIKHNGIPYAKQKALTNGYKAVTNEE